MGLFGGGERRVSRREADDMSARVSAAMNRQRAQAEAAERAEAAELRQQVEDARRRDEMRAGGQP